MTATRPTLQLFFTERLARQRQASPQTVTSYRDTFRLLLALRPAAHRQSPLQPGLGRPQRRGDLRVPGSPEAARGNSVRSRNARLAAIHSLFPTRPCAILSTPQLIRRVLAIPANASTARRLVPHRRRNRRAAGRPRPGRWEGRRDRALLTLGRANGPAAIGADRADLRRRPAEHRPTSAAPARAASSDTPLTPATAAILRTWLGNTRTARMTRCSPTRTGRRLSRRRR